MSGYHVYLCEDNAEEVINKSLEYLKARIHAESRKRAFEDCTKYWRNSVASVLRDDAPAGAKLSRIREMFGIPYEDGEAGQ
jgi:hypothetical protein